MTTAFSARRLTARCIACGARRSFAAAAAQGIDLSHGGPIESLRATASNGCEHEHEVIAIGDARAVRGDVTVPPTG